MSHEHSRPTGTDEELDLAVDEDEFLIQRYLDADLSAQELRNFESRLDVEVALQQRLEQCQALFSALDSLPCTLYSSTPLLTALYSLLSTRYSPLATF